MKNKPSTLLLLISIFYVACSSNRYTYAPELANNPLFTQKGESKVSANVFTNKPIPTNNHFSNGVNVQAAYAITNHVAATYSYNYKIEKDINYNNELSSVFSYFDYSNTLYKRNTMELGAGGFWFLDKKQEMQFSLFGGYGFGSFNITDKIVQRNQPATRLLSAKTSKYFIQPSFNFVDKYIGVSLALKASFLKYSSVSTNYLSDELSVFELNNLGNRTSRIYEPSINFQAKIKNANWLLLNLGAGISFQDYGQGGSHRWNFLYAGIGINPLKLLRLRK